MAKWQDAPVVDEDERAKQPAWMSAPIVEEAVVSLPAPRLTPAEAGKRAGEVFKMATEEHIPLSVADKLYASPDTTPSAVPSAAPPGTPQEELPGFLAQLARIPGTLAKRVLGGTLETGQLLLQGLAHTAADILAIPPEDYSRERILFLRAIGKPEEAEPLHKELIEKYEAVRAKANVLTEGFVKYALAGGVLDWSVEQTKPYLSETSAESVKAVFTNPELLAERVGGMIPYMAGTVTLAIATKGTAAPFIMTYLVEGEGARQDAARRGASPAEQADIAELVGLVNGAIEMFQVSAIINFAGGKAAQRAFAKKTTEIAIKKLAAKGLWAKGLSVGKAAVLLAAQEGSEEVAQQVGQEVITSGITGLPIEPGFWDRLLMAGGVAAIASVLTGGLLGGGQRVLGVKAVGIEVAPPPTGLPAAPPAAAAPVAAPAPAAVAAPIVAPVQPTPPAAAPAEAAPAIEAWQMTQAEYRQTLPPSARAASNRFHQKEIETALVAGKPVPPEVLADYPDLAPAEKVAPAVDTKALALAKVKYKSAGEKAALAWAAVARAEGRKANEAAKVKARAASAEWQKAESELLSLQAPAVGAEPKVAPPTMPGVLLEVVEEVVPFEVLAKGAPPVAPTVQAFARYGPEELMRMLGKIPGPYGSTVAETKEVGQSVKALRQALKNQKVEEATAKADLERMQAAYPDALADVEGVAATPLLDWMKGNKISAWPGLQAASDIRETLQGRPGLKKFFIHKKPKAGPPARGGLDQMVESAKLDKDSGFRGETTSDFLDQMVAESEKAAARAEGKVSTEEALRRLAREVPEEVGAELTERADRIAESDQAVDEARERLLAAAEPYLAVGAEVVVVEMTVEEAKKAAAAMARADQALRQAQLVQVAAERGLMTAQEQVKVLKAAVKLSGVPHLASVVRAVERAKTPEDMAAAQQELAWALEGYVKREYARRAARTARRVESWARRQKFDPQDRRAAALLQMASETSEAALMAQDLESVKVREQALTEGLYDYQTADELIKSDAAAKAAELTEVLRQEMDANALGRIDRAEVARPDVGRIRGLGHLVYKWLTTIEQVFGVDSRAEKFALEFLLGKENETTGARAYYRLLRQEDAWLNGAVKEATGMDRLKKSESYVDWVTRLLALDLPDAGRVELAVDEWMGLVNTCKDLDGNMQVPLVPLKRAFNPAEKPFAERLSDADREAMLEGLDREDPRILKAADVYWRWHQNKERFRKWSEAWHAVKGWWPEPLLDYYPLHRDILREAPGLLQVPGMEETASDRMTHAFREIGFMQKRVPDAKSALLIKGAEAEYLNHSRIGAALVAYGVPAKNIEKVLNAGSPSFLRQLEATVGRTVARSVWVDTVRHVLDTVGLSRGAGLQGNQWLDQVVHQGMSNIGVAYFVASPFTARSQLFGIFGKLSDPSSPTSVGDFLVGIAEALRHPMQHYRELTELSPLVEHRVAEAPALYMFGDIREAQGRRPMWAFARWWRRLKSAVVKKLFWARNTDAWTQVARYRTNYRYFIRQGMAAEQARVKAARMTEMDIENQDFPAHAGSADNLSQQATRSILRRGLVFAGQSRSSQANLFIRNLNRLRRDKDVKKFLKSLIGLLLTAIGISSTNVLRSLAKRKEWRTAGKAAGEFAAEMLSSIFGQVHGVRQIVECLRRPYGGIETLPLLDPVENLLGGVRNLYGAIDEWDEKKAWQAAQRMSHGMAALLGIPVVGAEGVYRIIKGLMPEEARRGEGSRAMREGADGRTAREGRGVGGRAMKEE